jgi:hypothetical protein
MIYYRNFAVIDTSKMTIISHNADIINRIAVILW